MMKNLYRGLAPAFFAMILFLFIRVANDVPMRRHYWDGNSLNFILKEVLPLILASYPMMAIQLFWVKWCRKKGISRWREYGFIILCTLFLGTVIMWGTRWMNGVTLNFYDTPIPIVVGVLFVGFSYSFLRNQTIQKAYEVQRLQLEKIKNDQLQTELKFLKAQYHPHFLFNALNTVYFQIEEKNEIPRRTLEILADLLRYQLYNEGDKVM